MPSLPRPGNCLHRGGPNCRSGVGGLAGRILGYDHHRATTLHDELVLDTQLVTNVPRAGEQNDYLSQTGKLVLAGDGAGEASASSGINNGQPTWEGFGWAGTNWQMAWTGQSTRTC